MESLINTTNYIIGKLDVYHENPSLSVNNLSDIFHVSPRTVNRWFREKRIDGYLINRKQYFHIDDVKAFYELNNTSHNE